MKTITEWFSEYSESHQNPTNKIVHKICVPVILFTIIGVLMHMSKLLTALVMVATMVFYARLDIVLAIAASAMMLAMASLALILPVTSKFYLALFGLAWVGQFYGHHVEGKKPSFLKDLQFLLIGPLWVTDHYIGSVWSKWKSRNPVKSPASVAALETTAPATA